MWCPSCSADVAAELTADERRFLCTRCQTELGQTAATIRPAVAKPAAAERDARELLARWSAHTLLDELLRPVVPKEPVPSPVVALPMASRKPETKSAPVVTPPSEKIRRRVVVRREAASVAMPVELPIITEKEVPPSRSGAWLSTLGHLAAYAGIGLITCGTALVIWSHYGGPASYAPSGWLINALGQMLFFLGLVNLVSGGLEQSAADFREQLLRLRTQLQRLETERSQEASSRPRRRTRTSRRDAA
jgi:hypothetical protein